MHAGVIGHPLFKGRRSRAVRSEAQRRERVLASARAGLAVGFVIYCEQASPGPYPAFAYVVVLAYLVYSLLLLVFLRAKQDSSPAFRLSLHAVETLWAALLCWFGGGAHRRPLVRGCVPYLCSLSGGLLLGLARDLGDVKRVYRLSRRREGACNFRDLAVGGPQTF